MRMFLRVDLRFKRRGDNQAGGQVVTTTTPKRMDQNMMRRVLTVVSVFLIGMFGAVGLAAAAPPYPAPAPITLSVTDVNGNSVTDANGNITVTVGTTNTFSGDGFDPLEGIDGNISYLGPNGLRSTLAASSLAAPTTFSDTADNNGHVDHELTFDQVGTATLTATGHNSGKSASITVQVIAVGATEAGGATSIAAAAGGASDGSGSSLASTGVSIAGPLLVGLAALLVGLALLFFGTRGVIRRKSSKSLGDA